MLLSVLLTVAIYFLWQTNNDSRPYIGVVFAVIIFIMVVIVEKMINTTYTITAQGEVIVHNGRFSKDIIIEVSHIKKIESIQRLKIFGKSFFSYLIIITDEGQHIAVRPNNEEDFVKKITKMQTEEDDDEEDDD